MTTSMTSYLPFKQLNKEPCPALAQRDGGLFDFIEVWPQENADLDPRRHLGK